MHDVVTGIEVVDDTRCLLGEGVVWDEVAQRVVWLDITGRAVHLRSGGRTRTVPLSVRPGFVCVGPDGEFLLGADDGFSLFDPATGTCTLLAPLEADEPDRRMNDGGADPRGRVLGGTMTLDMAPGQGVLHGLAETGDVRHLLADLTVPNGLAFPAPDTIYYIDSPRRAISVREYDISTGSVGAEHRVIDVSAFDGVPDGMALDADANLWVAFHEGAAVRCLDPSGRVLAEIPTPTPCPTRVAFGGADLRDLYITSDATGNEDDPLAGALFHCRPGAVGRPELRWSGRPRVS